VSLLQEKSLLVLVNVLLCYVQLVLQTRNLVFELLSLLLVRCFKPTQMHIKLVYLPDVPVVKRKHLIKDLSCQLLALH
jgi:hypothetical protein